MHISAVMRGLAVERQFCGGAPRRRSVLGALDDGQPSRDQAPRPPSRRARRRYVRVCTRNRVSWTRSVSATRGRRAPADPVVAETHCQQPDLAVTEADDVIGQFAHRRAVVDADARSARHVRRADRRPPPAGAAATPCEDRGRRRRRRIRRTRRHRPTAPRWSPRRHFGRGPTATNSNPCPASSQRSRRGRRRSSGRPDR